MANYKVIVLAEFGDLAPKLENLDAFLKSEEGAKLEPEEKQMLTQQHAAMKQYGEILFKRLQKWLDV